MESILDHRIKNNRVEYKIKWVGYSKNDSTWEPETNLESCPDILKNYKISKRLVEPSSKLKGPSMQRPLPNKTVKFREEAKKPNMKKKPYTQSEE